MSGFDGFLGNEKLIARLKRDIALERLSHAYIIEGREGMGKKTLARLICAAVSCRDTSSDRPCMQCVDCDKIMRDQSPDVIFITPEKDRVILGVDVIRRLREDAVFAANDLPMKFYIIPDADAMNAQAQNALLKILEEPPMNVMFLLLSEATQNLLTTIKSRAPTLRLEALDESVIDKALESDTRASSLKKSDEQAYRAAIKLSCGSLGLALKLTDPKSASDCLEQYKKAEQYLELLADRKSAADEFKFFEFATKLVPAKQRGTLEQIYTLLSDATRDLCAVKLASSPNLTFWTSHEKARQIADKFAFSHILRLTEIFMEARASLELNANLSLVQTKTAANAVSAGRRGVGSARK